MDLRHTLCSLGAPLDGKACMFGDNERSVITTSTVPHSSLNKRHNTLSYHQVGEAIASNVLWLITSQARRTPQKQLHQMSCGSFTSQARSAPAESSRNSVNIPFSGRWSSLFCFGVDQLPSSLLRLPSQFRDSTVWRGKCQMVHCLHHIESHSCQSLTEHLTQTSGL
jgi:hypothetical protein